MGIAGVGVPPVLDVRAAAAAPSASVEVAGLWAGLSGLAAGELPGMGLAAGDRPAADVEVLCSAVAVAEFELARRMAAAARAGGLPLVGDGAMLVARGWSVGWARRLARCGVFVVTHPGLGAVWAAGVITGEHVEALARRADRLTEAEMAAVIVELGPLWGQLSPHAVGVFVARVIRVLHPPEDDPDPGEAGAFEARSLSFAVTPDAVILAGTLPRLEGEAVIAAVDAFAERLRSTADHVPGSARRADGLVALVNAAHAAGSIPTRGGLPVAVSVTLDTTSFGDQVWSTSRGHTLTPAEQRFSTCDALVTPIVIRSGAVCPNPAAGLVPDTRDTGVTAIGNPSGAPGPGPAEGLILDAPGAGPGPGPRPAEGPAPVEGLRPGPGARITALAATLWGARIPLAVGRTARTATPAQRRALAARDRGCLIPGCRIPAEACQTHHVQHWAADGETDIENLCLLCWAHHRQVDLGMWTIDTASQHAPVPRPESGAPPGTPWPANHGAPWTITRTPRTRWRP